MMVFSQGLLVADWNGGYVIDPVAWNNTYVNTTEGA